MLEQRLLEHGIRPKGSSVGYQKLVCPRCPDSRKDPSLSLTIDDESAVWKCENCGWHGAVHNQMSGRTPSAPKRPARPPGDPNEAVLEWLANRGISAHTARLYRVGAERHYIPKIGAEVDCVAFTYYRDGQLINIKYRALGTNASAQVEGAEQILFGLDEIVYDDRVVIVGDECDALALEESRICNVVSVPDGALDTVKEGDPDPDDPKLAFLRNCADQLARLKRIIIAVNADGPGQALAEELARRLGRGRCSRVIWPKGCNGANDVLLQHGPEVLRNCVSRATSYPVPGLHHIDEFADVVLALYRQGRSRGLSTGWASLDEFVTVRAGELSLVTGIPNSGKSEFIDALMVNLAVAYGWRFAVCSFENPVPARIGLLSSERQKAALLQGLHAAGLDEGRNLILEYRPNVPPQALPQLAAELVALKVEVIVASGTQAVRAAQQATDRIPIVMTSSSDPVGTGLVASLAHPGGSVTGMSLFNPELSGKRLELLKEIAREIPRIAVLWNPDDPPAILSLKETEVAGQTLGITAHGFEVRRVEDYDRVFAAIIADETSAVVVLSSPVITTNAPRIAEWTLQRRLPAISWERGFAAAGGLMSYGPDLDDLARRSAVFVDKILNGAKPADLPVEQPTKFEFVINLKTAKALGLTVPQALLARADEVIE